jgi:type I restriction enzyme, S subunit
MILRKLALVRPIHSKIHSQWIAYQVFADIGKNQLLSSGYGGTKIQLNLTDIKDLWISLPSKEEQEKIIEFLKQKTAEIDRQKAKVKEAIELLKEYRTALITNAVTGKIDVRQVSKV